MVKAEKVFGEGHWVFPVSFPCRRNLSSRELYLVLNCAILRDEGKVFSVAFYLAIFMFYALLGCYSFLVGLLRYPHLFSTVNSWKYLITVEETRVELSFSSIALTSLTSWFFLEILTGSQHVFQVLCISRYTLQWIIIKFKHLKCTQRILNSKLQNANIILPMVDVI